MPWCCAIACSQPLTFIFTGVLLGLPIGLGSDNFPAPWSYAVSVAYLSYQICPRTSWLLTNDHLPIIHNEIYRVMVLELDASVLGCPEASAVLFVSTCTPSRSRLFISNGPFGLLTPHLSQYMHEGELAVHKVACIDDSTYFLAPGQSGAGQHRLVSS